MGERLDPAVWDGAFHSFLASPEEWAWLVSWARASSCLPLYCDWTHAFCLTREGDIVSHQQEEWPGRHTEIDHVVSDLRIINVALHEGRERHPWLNALLPSRPADAQTCSMCRGTGRSSLPPPMICHCGGAGWVPANDTWVNRDRVRGPTDMGTQVDELARCLVFGALLEEVTRRFGGYELVAHWTQGEFHHDVVLRLPEAATPMGARVLVVATNCNGGIKEVLGFNEIPDRAALWHHRCPTVPEFDGDLAPIVARAVTEHWFDPCELLVQMRGASCEPSTGGVNLVAAGNTPRESRDQAAGDRGMITSPRRRAA